MYVYSGSPTSCQISQWLQCSPPWLLMSGLSSHFFYYSVFSLLLSEASVTEILSKWLQDFNSLGNRWYIILFHEVSGSGFHPRNLSFSVHIIFHFISTWIIVIIVGVITINIVLLYLLKSCHYYIFCIILLFYKVLACCCLFSSCDCHNFGVFTFISCSILW